MAILSIPGPLMYVVRRLGRFALYLAAFFLVFLSYWLNRYFGVPELDQILYHLDTGVNGLIMADPVLQRRFLRWCIIVPLAAALLMLYLERLNLTAHSPRLRRIATDHPGFQAFVMRYLPGTLLLAVTLHWLIQISAVSHLFARFGDDYFGANYVPAQSVTLVEQQPKNLVLIYIESLESSYSNPAFGADLLAPLSRLDGARFASFRQAPGTGWTIAALVATQCGVPLKRVTLFDENTQGEALRSFLPGATCLSDILARHGYRNVFMGGASPSFAGKGKFLRAHSYHEIYGKEDWLGDGVRESDMNGWGLYDGDLFARARQKLAALQASHERFNLTLLTVNTHEPNGHLSADCRRRGFSGFEGVLGCTAQDLADFVQFIKDSGYLEDTNVVILGDHLARKNSLHDRLEALPERNVYNLFISADTAMMNTDQLLHFDLLPTLLEFNGFLVEGGRMGLGFSAFNVHAEHASSSRFDEMQQSLMNRSDTYLSLWNQPPAPTLVHVRADMAPAQ